MLHADRKRAESFGEDPERYDRARPSYPRALVDELLDESPASVLDVGCGTGIVAALFRAHGCRVLGVEPDERMARIAQGKGLDVEIARFESWSAGARRFDLLVCGQAWHWIDPVLGVAKAASVLHQAGCLAVFWNFGSPPPQLRAALADIYSRLAPDLERYSVLLGHPDRRLQTIVAGLAQTDSFTAPQTHAWSWTRSYTAEQWLEHLLTHSDHKALSQSARDSLLSAVAKAIEDRGGAFEMSYETKLVSARRR